jgi:hypothetical protein
MHYLSLPIYHALLFQTKMLAFASSSIRRHEPSRSSSGVELRTSAGHHHGAGNHEQ